MKYFIRKKIGDTDIETRRVCVRFVVDYYYYLCKERRTKPNARTIQSVKIGTEKFKMLICTA